MQDLVESSIKNRSLSEKYSDLSGSWQGRAVFALLEAPRFQASPREIATELAISLEELFACLDLLVDLQLVKVDSNGKYLKLRSSLDFRTMDLDTQKELASFKSVATEVLIRQSASGPCKFESSLVFTTKELLKEFIKKQDQNLSEFIEKSSTAQDKTVLVGYQYSMADMCQTAGGVK